MSDHLRSVEQRKRDVIKRLEHARDVWVATADSSGHAHLVPFSLSWDGSKVIVATSLNSLTARNIAKSHQARLAIGDTRDVVVLDMAAEIADLDAAGAEVSERFAARNGWDPRVATSGKWAYLIMTPVRVQAWQSEAELEGRNIMTNGEWLS